MKSAWPSPLVSIRTSYSFTDWLAACPHVLIRNTRPRSESDTPKLAPGWTCTPTSRTSIGALLSCTSWMPHAYRSAVPAWMPLFVSGNVESKPLPLGLLLFVHAPGVPATTFERPRGATRYGTARFWADASPAVLVATMSPRAVRTPPGPTPPFDTNVSSLGRAANCAAEMDSDTCTVMDWPCGTVTLLGETPTVPIGVPFVTTPRLYVASTAPVFVSVIAFEVEYAPEPGTYPNAIES